MKEFGIDKKLHRSFLYSWKFSKYPSYSFESQMSKFSQFWGPLEPWKDCHQFGYENIQITVKQVISNPVFVPGINEIAGLKMTYLTHTVFI